MQLGWQDQPLSPPAGRDVGNAEGAKGPSGPEAIRLLRDGRARLECIVHDQIEPALADFDAILADWPEGEEEPA